MYFSLIKTTPSKKRKGNLLFKLAYDDIKKGSIKIAYECLKAGIKQLKEGTYFDFYLSFQTREQSVLVKAFDFIYDKLSGGQQRTEYRLIPGTGMIENRKYENKYTFSADNEYSYALGLKFHSLRIVYCHESHIEIYLSEN